MDNEIQKSIHVDAINYLKSELEDYKKSFEEESERAERFALKIQTLQTELQTKKAIAEEYLADREELRIELEKANMIIEQYKLVYGFEIKVEEK